MTDEIAERARKMQESVNELGAGKPKDDSMGKAMGVVMVRALEHAYANGRGDARMEIEKAIVNLPVRMRQGVILVSLVEVLRIVHELDSTD